MHLGGNRICIGGPAKSQSKREAYILLSCDYMQFIFRGVTAEFHKEQCVY